MAVASAPASGRPSSPAGARPLARPAGPRAGRRTRRSVRLAVLASLVVAVLVSCLLSLALGARELAPSEVWTALVAPTGTEADLVVRELRLPRTVLALVAGAALAAAGVLMQGHTRNPLADPSLLGVSAGAALAVVLALRLGLVEGTGSSAWVAMLGALVAAAVVHRVATGARTGATPVTLALAGVAVSAMLGAVVSAVVLLDADTLDAYRYWAVGSVAGRSLDDVVAVLPPFALGALLAAANARSLDLLALGDDTARALGASPARARAVGSAAVALLTGAAVAVCGPIGFLGLVAPHIGRRLVGPDHRWLLPASVLLGPVLLLLADVVGRLVARPGELQVGIVLGVVGAPVFIAIVRSGRLVLR